MEKRVVIAVVLSIAVLYLYSYLFPPSKKPLPTPAQQQMSAQGPVTVAAAPAIPGMPQSTHVPTAAALASDVTVDTDQFTAVLSTKGATLKRLVLKKYKESAAPGAKQVTLINADTPANATVQTEGHGFPVNPETIYATAAGSVTVSGDERKAVEFTTTDGGVVYRKTYAFTGNGFTIDLDQQLVNGGTVKRDGSLQLTLTNLLVENKNDNRFETLDAVTLADNKVHTASAKDLVKEAKSYDKGILWTGFADKYFLSSVLAKDGSIASVQVKKTNGYVVNVVKSPAISLAPGQSATISARLYFGPRDLDILKAQGSRLEEVIDFGWFSAIAKPLLYTLKFFYKYLHNYGLAIIIITIILKGFFYPLTHKSYKSMKEMQKLQPKMAALKEKFKDDRDGLNRAVMELYKTHKVNPLGGCLPMVVQIPVFFALYKALMFSIELRQAPFFFWIQDLSAKDPYYVTPLIMGVTMFIQQKMTPTTGMDPAQAKMMLALPVVFTFMFLNFPSGLVLYWLVNNILTIAQQYYINKKIA
jgi:YidC/Oxa1 family membrane protein insertase